MHRVDLKITKAYVLTMSASLPFLEGAEIHIKDSRIVFLGPKDKAPPCEAAHIIDASHCLVIPGLINCHTHVPMTLFRGLADDLPLMKWLNEYIFPIERKMDKEFVYIGSLIGIGEMLLSGTTTFCDMYLFEESVARAASEAKVRCLLGEVLYDFPSPNYGPMEKGFEYTEWLIQEYKGDPLIRIALMPHATFTCSPDLLQRAKGLAQRYDVPIVIHVSETSSEVELILEKSQKTPVR
ncbi:MAG: amidohydrolase family protein, partial [Desulfatiglandales bacterium]